MGQPNCSIAREIAFPPGRLITLQFTCKTATNPENYGLRTFDVTVISTRLTDGSFQLVFTFDTIGGPQTVTTFITQYGVPIGQPTSTSPNIIPTVPTVTSSDTIITVKSPIFVNTAVYDLNTAVTADGIPYAVSATIKTSLNGVMSLPPSPDGTTTVPNIHGLIYLTQDEKQICEVDYIVTTETEISTYKQYCVKVGSVLRGGPQKNCDFASNPTLVTYAVLRLILSQVIGVCPFNKFDVNLLRRRYYAEFLRLLAAGPWRAFLQYIEDPVYGVTNYWKLFKK